MLKLKSQLACSYCSKIFKDPILLPFEDYICREHLSQRDVVKAKKIKCKKCNAEFQVKNNQFKSIKPFTDLIETQSYLSDEETSLKQNLEESLRKFFDLYDEFDKNRTQFESDVFDHFREKRFQVDEHRERLKVKIDDIALAMIEKIKEHEENYLKDLKESFSSFDHSKSLKDELNQIEETFRNPNLLIESIREMQRKQEESLKEIQSKLNQMTILKVNSEATNEFIPNLSFFNQKETSLFGSIRLYGYSNMNLFKSEILKDDRQSFELIKLCEFSPNDKWSLLYRGTRDGFEPSDFHSKCDGHPNTLTIFKAAESKFIFGGFTTVSWDSSNGWKSYPNAFIFSLTNKDNKPVKMKIDLDEHEYAIRCYPEYGPTFGGGHDICIANKANTTMESYSDLGCTYKHPQYAYETDEAQSFLAGSYSFQLDEIEVYQKE
jgi:hypothetical protein